MPIYIIEVESEESSVALERYLADCARQLTNKLVNIEASVRAFEVPLYADRVEGTIFYDSESITKK